MNWVSVWTRFGKWRRKAACWVRRLGFNQRRFGTLGPETPDLRGAEACASWDLGRRIYPGFAHISPRHQSKTQPLLVV